MIYTNSFVSINNIPSTKVRKALPAFYIPDSLRDMIKISRKQIDAIQQELHQSLSGVHAMRKERKRIKRARGSCETLER